MKKMTVFLLTLIMLVSAVVTGCGQKEQVVADKEPMTINENQTTVGEEQAAIEQNQKTAENGQTLRLVNGKIEVDAQLKHLAEVYKEETGVTVEIESVGGGVDIQGTIKGYYQGDNMPDIFINSGTADFSNWDGLLVDMSDQAWVSDTDQAYVDETYGTIGFPYTVEAIGLVYNAEILEKAGIDPYSLTGPSEMEKAFQTLDAMKEELGLTAVVGYCAEASAMYWSTGDHLFAYYLDGGLDRSDTTYIDLLNDGGQLDVERFSAYSDMVGLLNQYSGLNLLISGTYDQQVLNFASGKYAFVTQGSWIGTTITVDDAEAYEEAGRFETGMIPYSFLEGMDTLLINPPSWWAVYDGKNQEEALKFLQWCSKGTAQKILVEEAGFISPFKSCSYTTSDLFADSINKYLAAGKTSAWHVMNKKEGLAQNYIGQVFADYAIGNLDKDGFVKTMQQVLKNAYEN